MSSKRRWWSVRWGRLWPWVIPILAVAVAITLLVREMRSRGTTLVLSTSSNPGLVEGISELRFRGVPCGRVTEILVGPDLRSARIEVQLERWAGHLARQHSRFWAVTAELEVGRIRGLESLRSGAYITVVPGDGEPQREFELLPEAPTIPVGIAGQRYHVYAERSHGIKPGAPIYYRGVNVGTVAEADLAHNGSAVRLELHVRRRYTGLIRHETVFWAVSGFRADIGLLGGEIETGTLESFWSGGIELATPPDSPPIQEDTSFWLADSPDEDWLHWKPQLHVRRGP